jgi:replicative DNA helicase
MNIDLEAEKQLAITLTLNPSVWDYVAATLRAEMFAGDQSRAVFEAVKATVLAGKGITPIAVQARIVAAGKPGSVVPGWLSGRAVSVSEAQELADRVRTLWEGRTLAIGASAAASTAEKDPKAAKEALSSLLASVESVNGEGAKPIGALVMDWLMELEDAAKNPDAAPTFFPTGFRSLDKATGGLATGELSVLAARPGSGKSSFVIALAVNLAARGVPVCLFWLEDDRRDAVRRFLARRLEIDAWRLRGEPRKALSYVTQVNNVVDRASVPLYVDDTHGLTITDLQARMRRMHRERGIRVFILDHLGEVRIEREERWGDRHDLALGRVARVYRDTAKQLNAVPILVSQMNRQWEKRGTDHIPQMSDLDGSGQVEQAARVIAFVQMHKNADGSSNGTGDLHLVKATGGSTGTMPLKWDKDRMTWNEGA